MQEAFLTALRKHPEFARTINPEAWVRTVALRRVSRGWRHAAVVRRHRRATRPAEPSVEMGPEHVALVAALAGLEHQAADRSRPAPPCRPVHRGHRHRLDIPEGTVKSRLARGRPGWPSYSPRRRRPIMSRLDPLRELGRQVPPRRRTRPWWPLPGCARGVGRCSRSAPWDHGVRAGHRRWPSRRAPGADVGARRPATPMDRADGSPGARTPWRCRPWMPMAPPSSSRAATACRSWTAPCPTKSMCPRAGACSTATSSTTPAVATPAPSSSRPHQRGSEWPSTPAPTTAPSRSGPAWTTWSQP